MSDKVKMLLVDDDPSLVDSLVILIRTCFAERVSVTETTDPVAARDIIEKLAPDLVLTDLEMPVIDGFSILKYAKRRNLECQVIIYTAHSSPEAIYLGQKLEAADYIAKSAGVETLLRSLEAACDRIQMICS